MKRGLWFILVAGLLAARCPIAVRADPPPILYEVWFKDAVVATQAVTIARTADATTVTTTFAAQLPVFIALHHYSEEMSATVRSDGTVERLHAIRRDGPVLTEVTGEMQEDGLLRVVRTDPDGVSTNFIARADYDFHSLSLYGTPPAEFLPTNSPARVLSIAEGRVEPVLIQAIAESETTFERQPVSSTHLIWTAGPLVSHSWHPERYSNLPRRYVRQTENGEFSFTLPR